MKRSIHPILNYVNDILTAKASSRNMEGKDKKQEVLVSRRRLVGRVVCLNVDDASKGNLEVASTGGLIHNGLGTFLYRFTANLGICTKCIQKKVWGILLGGMVWDKGFHLLEVESDSQVLAHLINEQLIHKRYNPLLRRVHELLNRDWQVSMNRI